MLSSCLHLFVDDISRVESRVERSMHARCLLAQKARYEFMERCDRGGERYTVIEDLHSPQPTVKGMRFYIKYIFLLSMRRRVPKCIELGASHRLHVINTAHSPVSSMWLPWLRTMICDTIATILTLQLPTHHPLPSYLDGRWYLPRWYLPPTSKYSGCHTT